MGEPPALLGSRVSIHVMGHRTTHIPTHVHIFLHFLKMKICPDCKCPSTVEWITKMSSIHTMEYYKDIKRNEAFRAAGREPRSTPTPAPAAGRAPRPAPRASVLGHGGRRCARVRGTAGRRGRLCWGWGVRRGSGASAEDRECGAGGAAACSALRTLPALKPREHR